MIERVGEKTSPILKKIPDIQVLLDQSRIDILDLNEYVYDADTPVDCLRWLIVGDPSGPQLRINSQSHLSVIDPNTEGVFSAVVSVVDGSTFSSQGLSIQVLRILFKSAFFDKPLVMRSADVWESQDSLYDWIVPADIPHDCVVFEILLPLPPGIEKVVILPDGKFSVKSAHRPLDCLKNLRIAVRYVSPTPTFSPTPTPSPVVSPTPTPVLSLSPGRTPVFSPAPIVRPSPSPSLQPDLLLVSCNQNFVFTLDRIEPVGLNPIDLASFDGNKDGIPDFLSADFGSDTATLLMSRKETGGYERTDLIAGGEGCLNIRVDDLDCDGWDDLILLNAYYSHIRIYWGDRSMGFLEWSDIDLPVWILPLSEDLFSAQWRFVTSGRFWKSDARQLIFVDEDQLEIYSVGRDRTIQQQKQYSLDAKPVQIESFDLDQDGIDELAITYANPGRLDVYSLAGGSLRKIFSKDLDIDIHGDSPYGLIGGWMDLDGFLDVAVYTFSGNLHIGFGDGCLGVDWICRKVPCFVMKDFAGGDYNGDGEWEFVLAGWDIESENPCLALVCADEKGLYDNPVLYPIPRVFPLNQIFSLVSVDRNPDRLADLVVADRVRNQLVFFINRTTDTSNGGTDNVQPQKTPSRNRVNTYNSR